VRWELRHPGQLRFGILLTFSFAIGEQWDESSSKPIRPGHCIRVTVDAAQVGSWPSYEALPIEHPQSAALDQLVIATQRARPTPANRKRVTGSEGNALPPVPSRYRRGQPRTSAPGYACVMLAADWPCLSC